MEYTLKEVVIRSMFITFMILLIIIALYDLFQLIQTFRSREVKKIKKSLVDFGCDVALAIFIVLFLWM